MIKVTDLLFTPQGTEGLHLDTFDCGHKSVNEFFREEAQDYQDELFGKTYYFCLPDSPSDIVAGFTVANSFQVSVIQLFYRRISYPIRFN